MIIYMHLALSQFVSLFLLVLSRVLIALSHLRLIAEPAFSVLALLFPSWDCSASNAVGFVTWDWASISAVTTDIWPPSSGVVACVWLPTSADFTLPSKILLLTPDSFTPTSPR